MPPDTQTLDVKLEQLHTDVGEIKSALGKLSDAIIKLALIEERQTMANVALERAFKALERVEARISVLEHNNINNKRTSNWVDKVVTAAVGIILLLVLKKTGIL
jgi:CHAD domain-containing protein